MQFANKLRFAVLATVLLGCTQILAVEHIHQHGGHSVQHRHHNRHAAEIAPLNTRELEGYFVAREDVAVDARDQLLKPHGHKRKHRSRKQKVKKHAKSRKTSTAFALPASAEALTTGVSSTPSSSSPVVNSRDFDDAFELDARESHAKQAHKHNSKARKHRKGQGKHRTLEGKNHFEEAEETRQEGWQEFWFQVDQEGGQEVEQEGWQETRQEDFRANRRSDSYRTSLDSDESFHIGFSHFQKGRSDSGCQRRRLDDYEQDQPNQPG
ncbi:hypothetical protein CPB83DRAFT_698075 [Crepidotus variabilis]|uniref:Uncharacterized protein n=1 Tax=Crepidotus variabilis TaxID=179855 RepID=A0A9P6E5Y6_9AGAR|nr:hypothetical protein CPB83DRAFT_698075 [Crepidotus variabilis]